MRILFRGFAALISSVIFSIIVAATETTPVVEQQTGTYYFSFFELLIMYSLFITPVYFLVGIPWSLLVDILTKKKSLFYNKYLHNLFLYCAGGMLISLIIVILEPSLLNDFYGGIALVLLGGFASVLFYHIAIPFDMAFYKYNESKKLNALNVWDQPE